VGVDVEEGCSMGSSIAMIGKNWLGGRSGSGFSDTAGSDLSSTGSDLGSSGSDLGSDGSALGSDGSDLGSADSDGSADSGGSANSDGSDGSDSSDGFDSNGSARSVGGDMRAKANSFVELEMDSVWEEGSISKVNIGSVFGSTCDVCWLFVSLFTSNSTEESNCSLPLELELRDMTGGVALSTLESAEESSEGLRVSLGEGMAYFKMGVVRGDKSASSVMAVKDGVEVWEDIISAEENSESESVWLPE
jgi:hypothetical protein